MFRRRGIGPQSVSGWDESDPGPVRLDNGVEPVARGCRTRQCDAAVNGRRTQRCAGLVSGQRPCRVRERSGWAAGPVHEIGDRPVSRTAVLRSDVLFKNADGWSADDKWIVIRSDAAKTQQDIWLLPATASRATPFVIGRTRSLGRPSPDSKWIASPRIRRGELSAAVSEPGKRTQSPQPVH